jgi:hypothetical protein
MSRQSLPQKHEKRGGFRSQNTHRHRRAPGSRSRRGAPSSARCRDPARLSAATGVAGRGRRWAALPSFLPLLLLLREVPIALPRGRAERNVSTIRWLLLLLLLRVRLLLLLLLLDALSMPTLLLLDALSMPTLLVMVDGGGSCINGGGGGSAKDPDLLLQPPHLALPVQHRELLRHGAARRRAATSSARAKVRRRP